MLPNIPATPPAKPHVATEVASPYTSTKSLEGLRAKFAEMYLAQRSKPKAVIADLQRDLSHGWLLPFLVEGDDILWGRWDYWAKLQLSGELPKESIPEISFNKHPEPERMLARSLDAVPFHGRGGWQGWSSFEYVNYFLDWLLYGFGHGGQKELPEEPRGCEGASMRLYQVFQLEALQLWPYDYLGDMLAESRHGRHNGFYPTPHCVAELMARMTMIGEDCRAKTVCDPCVGTGRMLLHASNHSLRLYAQDIDLTMCKVTLVNGYLWAPWLVRPISWLDRSAAAVYENASSEEPEKREVAADFATAMSEEAVEVAPPHYQAKLFDTEFDREALPQTAPVLKRRKRGSESAGQMNLLDI